MVLPKDCGLQQDVLVDEHVRLRAWKVEDAPALVELCRDREILRWTGVPEPYTVDLAATRAQRAEQLRAAGEALLYAICDPRSGQLLGALDLRFHPSDAGIAEVAYMLGAHARGRGVMTAAVRLLCAHAFDKLGIRRVELLHHPENHASAGVARRAGFTFEGVLRSYRVKKDAVAEDRLIHSLLHDDPRDALDVLTSKRSQSDARHPL